ncbi:hypothetical protein M0657_005979 [Pyricularia oryzae]|nr:hypothetical protein M0657_005979 [Pyricularia oryzae]
MDSTAQLFHRCYARRSLYVSAALPFFFFSFFFFFSSWPRIEDARTTCDNHAAEM